MEVKKEEEEVRGTEEEKGRREEKGNVSSWKGGRRRWRRRWK